MPLTHSILLLQLVVILATARGLGLLLRYFGQPAVIGEMAAGIVLGPIVFGALAPDLQAQLFAKESLTALGSLSQLGLVLFMFIVGAELRAPDGVRAQIKAAGMVSVLSVLLPMGLGLAIAPLLYPQLAPPGVAFWPFALFIAVAMAVTAFPVLARILKDRNLTQTPIGRLALGSAAIADVLAWIMLALVIALIASKTGWPGFWRAIGGLFGIAIVVFVALRPMYARLLARRAHDGQPGGMMLALLLIGAFACAAATEWLGLHAVFGAFLFGACLPRDERLLHTLVERIEHIAVIVLMPIFFALAGLNTTPDPAGRGRRQGIRRRGWRAHRRLRMAREFRNRFADECARDDGADRHQGRTGRRRDRQCGLHHADGDGYPHHGDDHADAESVRKPQAGTRGERRRHRKSRLISPHTE